MYKAPLRSSSGASQPADGDAIAQAPLPHEVGRMMQDGNVFVGKTCPKEMSGFMPFSVKDRGLEGTVTLGALSL
jgi:hypothetical protein